MAESQTIDATDLLALSADVVSSYVSNNSLQPQQVPELIREVYATMTALSAPETVEVEELVPAVPIKKSITKDYLICLEDGKELKMLKRHLMAAYNMTPDEYRAKWGLKPDYPMVAPNYSATRKKLAKQSGLGRPRKS